MPRFQAREPLNQEDAMLRAVWIAALIGWAGMAIAGSALAAGDKGTAPEAQALVKKVIAAIKEKGKDAVYGEISKGKTGPWADRDLYPVVYRLDGVVMAHGANAKMVGKDFSDATDIDGKPYVKERMELAKQKESFWQDYKFTNPTTKKIQPKSMYCERFDGTAVCAGIYKS
jgi:signal transduction histidine kinase